MSEPEFHDKEEAWAYFAGQQKSRWENLSEAELIAQVENGNYDLFFTLPEVVAAKLPREKALLTLFKRVLEQDTDYLVNYHTLDNLLKILGNKDGLDARPIDPLNERVLRPFHGEQERREACRELWERITARYPNLKAEIFDFSVPAGMLQHHFEIQFFYQGKNFAFYHADKAFCVKTFEEVLTEKFATFRSFAWFAPDAALKFQDSSGKRRALITGFNFPCELTLEFGHAARVILADTSPGPWFLADPVILQLRGERNNDLEDRLADFITDPLGICSMDYSRFKS